MFAGPGNVLVVTDLEQQVELLGEQRVVVLESEAEQREGIDERAAATTISARPCEIRSSVAKF